MLSNLLYILIAILMLGVIIIIHELGHFWVGRACGIGVVEFSVGMGPKLFGWRRKDIDYSIRALPIGGYCKFVGEDEDNPAPNAMNSAPVWKRFLTVLAGPMMNFVLAYIAVVIVFVSIPMVVDITPTIEQLSESMPAQSAGLRVGDTILAANGVPISNDVNGVTQLRELIQTGASIELTVEREGETLSFPLSPAKVQAEDGSDTYQIGVVFGTVNATETLPQALVEGARQMRSYSTMMLDILRKLIFKFEGAENMAGAIGMVSVVSEQLRSDLRLVLDYTFLISLNLGIMNLIPFPGLDGSRLLFLLIEAVRRKPVPIEKEGLVHAIGLVILLGLAAVLAVHDVMTYIL
ncbi:MAG: site-2 protease family protein [Clostridia bacterium]|nr:site-2 protease family protein [Clostridia bacterium]